MDGGGELGATVAASLMMRRMRHNRLGLRNDFFYWQRWKQTDKQAKTCLFYFTFMYFMFMYYYYYFFF